MLVRGTYVALTDGGGSSRPTELTYDPVTGTWVPSTSTNEDSKPQTSEQVSDPNSSSQVDSQTAADKEYIEIEFNTLMGDLALTSTEKSIRIKVNDTVQLNGMGKYLSGLYFVAAIRRTLNKDSGYTHTLSLIKNGFGDSLKKAPEDSKEDTSTRKEEVPKTSPEVKNGDTIRIVGENATYSNAHDGVKVPEWVKKKTLTIQQVSSDGTRVLLQPINSWTYISNIQKV